MGKAGTDCEMSYVVLASFMKTTYDISLYYQILPHSHMILSASRIRIIGLGRSGYWLESDSLSMSLPEGIDRGTLFSPLLPTESSPPCDSILKVEKRGRTGNSFSFSYLSWAVGFMPQAKERIRKERVSLLHLGLGQ